MMYKDLNHLSLTIADKLLGVASHFSLAVHVRARPVDIDILVQVIPPTARNNGKLLLRFPNTSLS